MATWEEILKMGRVSKHYGTNPGNGIKYSNSSGKHSGTDIVLKDSNIPAFVGGTVERVGYDSDGWGNYAVIKDQNGYYNIYAHMAQKPAVSEGQKVNAGDILGIQGMTGQATREHLHFEVRKNYKDSNSHINPGPYLNDKTKWTNGFYRADEKIEEAGGVAPLVGNFLYGNVVRVGFILIGIFCIYVAITKGMFGGSGE